jgi:hypothetical protein
MAERKPLPSHFECEAAYVPLMYTPEGTRRIFSVEEVKAILASQNAAIPPGIAERVFPVGLRWRVSPELGLPITPFTVWRKIKKSTIAPVQASLQRATGKTLFLNGPFYRMVLAIKNNTTGPVTVDVTTLNSKYQEKGGKRFTISLTASGTTSLVIDHPNVSGVKINSLVSITSALGITMRDYVNDPAWERVQVVGLPFKPGSIDTTLYTPDKQGFIGALTDPETACIQRADMYRAFVNPSPAVATDGTALPGFMYPKGDELLNAYRQATTTVGGSSGTLLDIREMFEKVYKQAPALLLGKQKNFIKTVHTLGIVDPANPNPKQNATFENPVCSTTLLSATTDCWHALGLGFGTIDFIPLGNPAGGVLRAAALPTGLMAYDYMVTGVFKTPVIELVFDFPVGLKEKWTGFEETEFAAICHFDLQLPPSPVSLQADTVSENRPLHRDDFYYEEVRLSWIKEAIQDRSPLCFAIAFRNNVTGEPVRLLNSGRPFIPGVPQPYIPAKRADAGAEDPPGREGSAFLRFFHDRSPAPFAGSVSQQYYVAAQNVFGHWSSWTLATHTLSAKPPQVPRIVSANFISRTNGITNHVYPASLELVVNYDWQDRTPERIELAGTFLPAPGATPPLIPGIMMSNAGGIINKYQLRFSGDIPLLVKLNAANVPEPVPATEGTVLADPGPSTGSSNGNPTTSNPDMRTYRVFLNNLQLDFSSQSKLWFAVYARATELKNPTAVSPYSPPVKFATADPLPRVPPAFVPEIKWASLPDATNTSRYHLKFPAVAGASGYAVYRATELSLRDRLSSISFPATGNIFQRRDALNSATPFEKSKAVDAFTRVNTKMITQPEIELEMDGDTQGLFIYAVSSFSEQAVESKLSDWIYVAVPEKITPAPPLLTGLVDKTPVIPKAVLRLSPGAGANTSGIEIYSSRNRRNVNDVNTMGPAIAKGPQPGWEKIQLVNGVEELVLDPAESFHFYKIEQPILPGWAPYFYRAVGLGTDQPINGKFAGRSASSNLLEILPPVPATAPEIIDPSLLPNPGGTPLRLSFKTNAYHGESRHGAHSVFISRQNPEGNYDVIAGGEIPGISKLQQGTSEPPNQLIRLTPGMNGVSTFVFNMPIASAITMKITVIDPLGRKKEIIAGYKLPESNVRITALSFRRQLTEARLIFKTNVSKIKPVQGEFTLHISLRKGLNVRNLLTTAMHKIPDTLQIMSRNAGIAGGTTQDAMRLFTYTVVFRGLSSLSVFGRGATIIVSITDPAGVQTSAELRL